MPSPSPGPPERAESLDDDFLDDLEAIERLPGRVSRPLPRFVPFQPEMFAHARDPWGIHSLLDPFRLCLPEISVTTALAAICGVLAGRLLAPFMDGIDPLWVFGFYLTAHFMNLGSLYLDAKGGSSSRLKGRLRTLMLGLFLFTLPHAVAFGLLNVSR